MTQTARVTRSFPQPLRIALLEDDTELRERILAPGLLDYGFEVTGAGTAAELYRNMLTRTFDIVVLDIGLPDENGVTVARHLRDMSSMGIVMLTGNHGTRDRVHALNVGADAYLSKPVDLEVLAATLHSLGRRLGKGVDTAHSGFHAASTAWHLGTDGWRLVSPNGISIVLTAPERSLLSVLVEAQGQPVARDTLIAALCSDVYDFDPHRLETLVHRLRRKTHDAGAGVLPLMTARGCGYLFVSDC